MLTDKDQYEFVTEDALRNIVVEGKPYPVRNEKLVLLGEDEAAMEESIRERRYMSDDAYGEAYWTTPEDADGNVQYEDDGTGTQVEVMHGLHTETLGKYDKRIRVIRTAFRKLTQGDPPGWYEAVKALVGPWYDGGLLDGIGATTVMLSDNSGYYEDRTGEGTSPGETRVTVLRNKAHDDLSALADNAMKRLYGPNKDRKGGAWKALVDADESADAICELAKEANATARKAAVNDAGAEYETAVANEEDRHNTAVAGIERRHDRKEINDAEYELLLTKEGDEHAQNMVNAAATRDEAVLKAERDEEKADAEAEKARDDAKMKALATFEETVKECVEEYVEDCEGVYARLREDVAETYRQYRDLFYSYIPDRYAQTATDRMSAFADAKTRLMATTVYYLPFLADADDGAAARAVTRLKVISARGGAVYEWGISQLDADALLDKISEFRRRAALYRPASTVLNRLFGDLEGMTPMGTTAQIYRAAHTVVDTDGNETEKPESRTFDSTLRYVTDNGAYVEWATNYDFVIFFGKRRMVKDSQGRWIVPVITADVVIEMNMSQTNRLRNNEERSDVWRRTAAALDALQGISYHGETRNGVWRVVVDVWPPDAEARAAAEELMAAAVEEEARVAEGLSQYALQRRYAVPVVFEPVRIEGETYLQRIDSSTDRYDAAVGAENEAYAASAKELEEDRLSAVEAARTKFDAELEAASAKREKAYEDAAAECLTVLAPQAEKLNSQIAKEFPFSGLGAKEMVDEWVAGPYKAAQQEKKRDEDAADAAYDKQAADAKTAYDEAVEKAAQDKRAAMSELDEAHAKRLKNLMYAHGAEVQAIMEERDRPEIRLNARVRYKASVVLPEMPSFPFSPEDSNDGYGTVKYAGIDHIIARFDNAPSLTGADFDDYVDEVREIEGTKPNTGEG